MKSFFASLLLFSRLIAAAQQPPTTHEPSPLSVFSTEWNQPRFLACNTAANASYLSAEEKKLIYILNLAHADPQLFANTVVEKYPDFISRPHLKDLPEYRSLLDTLKKLKPLSLLYPDSLCFVSAKCHAISAGQQGYVGHERQTEECKAKKHHQGECCQYGYGQALAIVMALLIDENVPSLGHRFLCLSSYGLIGVSIQPHKTYGTNAVLDFYF